MKKRVHAPWSLSKANIARQCGLRFHYQYVEKRKGQRIRSSAGRIGSAVHTYLELLLKGSTKEQAMFKASTVDRLTREEQLAILEFIEPTDRFLNRFKKFCDKYTAKGYTVQTLVEERWAFLRDGAMMDDWFDRSSFWRGIVDVAVSLEKDGERKIVIIDHKTGQPRRNDSGQFDLAEYREQIDSYAVAAYYRYPDLVGVQTALHWLRADHDSDVFAWTPYRSRQKIETDLLPWFFEFYDTAQHSTEQDPAASPGSYCTWCAYHHLCPVKQRP